MSEILKKQVHLDFHTSPHIPGIGSRFSKENFQQALREARLDSITVFAKCHHGLCYYPTEVGTMHPHLSFDLTGAMVEAAHEIGVRAPVYITAGWSDLDARQHPEWILIDPDIGQQSSAAPDNRPDADTPKPHGGWTTLCLSDGNGYTQHIYELTEEVCRRYKDLDGLFFDICSIGTACYCESCKKSMIAMGLDPDNKADAKKHLVMKRQAFMQKCGDILRKYHPNATIFFNGSASAYRSDFYDYQSHFDMENLPTAWGGYNSLPIRARILAQKGKAVVGMTGKFHLDWGEFGGFKSPEALKYEVAVMGMYGVGACVGDHMHPDGEMEPQTYQNIGYAYRYLDSIAPYCYGGQLTANIGIWLSKSPKANEGVSHILLENQLDFDIAHKDNLHLFDTVILPGEMHLDEDILKALEAYLAGGGKLIVVGDALVKDGAFALDIGIEYLGKSRFDCGYLTTVQATDDLPNAPLLCDLPGHIAVAPDAEVIAQWIPPYFSRTYGHFCGHKNTPHDKNARAYPAIAKKGNVVYVSHPLPEQYVEYGSLYHKRYFMLALNLVYGGSPIRVEGLGSQGRCVMIRQPEQNRYCIHMTYATPTKRGKAEIIEDIPPLYGLAVELDLDKRIRKVSLPLTGEILPFSAENGKLHFTVPKLCCHGVITVEYE